MAAHGDRLEDRVSPGDYRSGGLERAAPCVATSADAAASKTHPQMRGSGCETRGFSYILVGPPPGPMETGTSACATLSSVVSNKQLDTENAAALTPQTGQTACPTWCSHIWPTGGRGDSPVQLFRGQCTSRMLKRAGETT